MKLDAALPAITLKQVPHSATAAEAIGFAGLWTQETRHDPFLPHALIASHTRQIQMGTGVAISFARSPATLAYTAWDLAEQSDGRFMLGLGTQVKAHIERRFGMEWPDSVTGKLREQILAIRAFWNTWQNGAPLNFRGKYYKITLISPFFNPGPIAHPNIPIYIAGVNTHLAHLAGELCQGFHVHPLHTRPYLQEILLPAIQAGAQKNDLGLADVEVVATAFAATTSQEREYCRQQISFYAATPSYRAVLNLHGWGEVGAQLSALAARGKWDQMPALITDDILDEFCTWGNTPTELAAALHKRYHGLANRLALYSAFIPGERDSFWRELKSAFA